MYKCPIISLPSLINCIYPNLIIYHNYIIAQHPNFKYRSSSFTYQCSKLIACEHTRMFWIKLWKTLYKQFHLTLFELIICSLIKRFSSQDINKHLIDNNILLISQHMKCKHVVQLKYAFRNYNSYFHIRIVASFENLWFLDVTSWLAS